MIDDATLDLPAVELSRRLELGELSSTELTRAYLARIERIAPKLNCFITITAQRALDDAARADAARAAGKRGPLLGLPYAVKDAIDTAGIVTTWGTKSQLQRIPDRDARVIEQLTAVGAVLLGKTSLTELCNAFTVEHREDAHPGPHRNPWDLSRWAGGSSAGSAAAVAAGLCAFALGTETWGSIEVPADHCGVVGLRPTYDLISRTGAQTLSWSLDKIGFLCRDARDAHMLLPALATIDTKPVDATKLRVGLVDQMAQPAPDPANEPLWAAAKERLRSAGLALEMATLPDLPGKQAIDLILETDLFVALEPLVRANVPLFDRQQMPEKLAIHKAVGITADDYVRATRVRTMVQAAYRTVFERYDVLVAFGRPELPHEFGKKTTEIKKPGGRAKLSPDGNLCGLPAITIPIGFTAQNLPRSMSFVAAPFEEHKLFAIAELFQSVTDYHKRRPKL